MFCDSQNYKDDIDDFVEILFLSPRLEMFLSSNVTSKRSKKINSYLTKRPCLCMFYIYYIEIYIK